MPLQKVEIEVDVPDGWEAVAFRCPLYGEKYLTEIGVIQQSPGGYADSWRRLIIRKKPDPVAEWIANHQWLPEGRWVYRWDADWYITTEEPHEVPFCGHNTTADCDADIPLRRLALILGRTFTPPPCDLVQVKRAGTT